MADEKDEKFDEKDLEKRDEKSAEEKNWEEKYRRDPISAIIWALILIYAGVILLAYNLGYLNTWLTNIAAATNLAFVADLQVWSVILLGAGILLLIDVLIRLLIPEYRRGVGGTIVFAFILIAVALGDQIGWTVVLPLILIGAGLAIIVRGLFRSR
jgi:uncharacterized membrane protein YkgB